MTFIWVLACIVAFATLGAHLWHIYQTLEIHQGRFKGTLKNDGMNCVKELVQFADDYQNCTPRLELRVNKINDPFVRICAETILNGTLRGHELLKSLRQRSQTLYAEEMGFAKRLSRLNDSVPAVGWALSIAGTFWMLRDPQTLSFDHVVWGLTILGMYGLYSLVFGYFLMAPAIRHVVQRARRNHMRNLLLVDGVRAIMEKRRPYEILDTLNLALPENQKVDWDQIFDSSKGMAA